MKRSLIVLLVVLCMGVLLVSANPARAAIINSGQLETLKWSLDDEGTLFVEDTYNMPDYSKKSASNGEIEYLTPWRAYNDKIVQVICSNSISKISEGSFAGLTNLTSVVLPQTLNTIDKNSFKGCSSLKEISLSNEVSYIGENTFSGCDNLIIYGQVGSCSEAYAKINDIKFVGIDAEHDISNKELSVQTVCLYNGKDAKPDVKISGLKEGTDYSVSYYNNSSVGYGRVIVYGKGAYTGSFSKSFWIHPNEGVVKRVRDGYYKWKLDEDGTLHLSKTESVPDKQVYFNNFYSTITSLVLDANMRESDAVFFDEFTSLKSVYLTENVEEFDTEILLKYPTVDRIDVDHNNKVYASYKGVLYSKDMKTLLRCPLSYTGKLVIPSGVEEILHTSCCSTSKLKSVTIPGSVSDIGAFAFRDSGISKVYFNEGLVGIGLGAFYNTNLKSVALPDSLGGINKDAFSSDNPSEGIKSIAFGKGLVLMDPKCINTPESMTILYCPKVKKSYLDTCFGTKYRIVVYDDVKPPYIKRVTSNSLSMIVQMNSKPKYKGGYAYQIAYKKATDSAWKYTTTTSSQKTIKKLKKNKTYKVKSRTYQIVNGYKYYSKWSSEKTIRIR